MKFIKKFHKDKETPDSVKYHLHRHLSGTQKARGTQLVHASEMWKTDGEFCPREYALLDILKKNRPDEFLSTSQRSTFNQGNMFGNWIAHLFADMGLAVGDWECKHCGNKYEFQKRPTGCDSCGHKHFLYHECRFISQETGLSCGVDLIRITKGNKHRIVELKTMKDEAFKDLAGPLAEHKIRTTLYLRIIADSGRPEANRIDTTSADILYYSKSGWGPKDTDVVGWKIRDAHFSPFKEYEIKRNDKSTETKWYHARRLKEFREGHKGIPLGLCPTQFCKRAKTCSVAEECFSGRYKGEE